MSSLIAFFQGKLQSCWIELSLSGLSVKKAFFWPRRTLKAQEFRFPSRTLVGRPPPPPTLPIAPRWLPVKSSSSPTDASTPALSDTGLLAIRPSRSSPNLQALGDSFSIAASTLWNALIADIHITPTLTCLRCLKQHFYYFFSLTWFSDSHFLLFLLFQTKINTWNTKNVIIFAMVALLYLTLTVTGGTSSSNLQISCYFTKQMDYWFGNPLMQLTYSVICRLQRFSEPPLKFYIAFNLFLCRFEWGQPSKPAANEKIKNYTYRLIQCFFPAILP